MLHHQTILLSLKALHLPDGFLSAPVAVVGWLLAILAVAFALRQTREQLGEKQIPYLGVMAAFIFAAQAINFPVAGGTSGHLLGGALAAIVLGPWSAVLIMTAVIGLQALMFQDGGLLVMGWNIVNMGLLTALTGWTVYSLAGRIFKQERTRIAVAAGAAAWLSVEAAALATSLELAISGTSPLAVALPAMVGVHAFIGIGEAVITVGALLLIFSTRSDLMQAGKTAPGQSSARWAAIGLVIALLVAVLSITSSSNPDGLERVASDSGFMEAAAEPLFRILPDYNLPITGNTVFSGVLAVVLGTLMVAGFVYLIGRITRRPKQRTQDKPLG